MIDIVGIGELLIDFTPIKNKEGIFFKQNPGGAPCNMLAMAQSMGSKTAFIGKVGHDQFGKMLKETLVSKEIDVTGLTMSNEYNTTLAFVHLDDTGERSFSFYRDGCADVMLELNDIDFKLIDQAKVLHFGSLSFTTEPSLSTLIAVLNYAKENKKIISYDPNYRPALWENETKALEGMKLGLKYCDLIKVSDEEALLITKASTIEEAAGILFDSGIQLVCVTLGDKGCYFHHHSGTGYVKGFKSKVIDTTGAGDSFWGTVVHHVHTTGLKNLNTETLSEIMSKGNAAASIVIESYGGIPSIPTKEMVLKRCEEL